MTPRLISLHSVHLPRTANSPFAFRIVKAPLLALRAKNVASRLHSEHASTHYTAMTHTVKHNCLMLDNQFPSSATLDGDKLNLVSRREPIWTIYHIVCGQCGPDARTKQEMGDEINQGTPNHWRHQKSTRQGNHQVKNAQKLKASPAEATSQQHQWSAQLKVRRCRKQSYGTKDNRNRNKTVTEAVMFTMPVFGISVPATEASQQSAGNLRDSPRQ